MKNAQHNQVEPKNVEQKATGFEAVELHVDCDSVNISKTRYTELIKSEVTLEIIEKAYHNSKSYQFDDFLTIMLGPKGDPDAQ